MFNQRLVLICIMFTNFTFLKSQDFSDDFSDESQSEAKLITISGNIKDASTNRSLSGANITVDGSDIGTASDGEGFYTIEDIQVGSSITASVIGYEDLTLYADVELLDFNLEPNVIEMSALEVLASRAGDVTPVSYSDVNKDDLELRLSSRDIPLAMNTVPSVYATGNGGGAGDGRINVRGFNQRNVGIMINGIPVNDMENGWVYWSNWDGLADATSSIQMQKGLSMVNLATPSVGGTMNIITDPARQNRRAMFKQELGAWGFLKTTLSAHSGLLLDDKLALSATLVRKAGDGYVDGTWTDAYAYYVGASYNLSEQHRFEFYAMGAPQRHGENRYKQNIAAYDEAFAKDLDSYDESALYENDGEFIELGRDFNQNVASISQESQDILDASSGQYFEMYSVFDGVDRQEAGSLSQVENFFHKPLVSLNHFWTINQDMRLSSSLYYSGGRGGGTGFWGDLARKDANGVSDLGNYKFYYGPSPWTWDFDGTIAANASDASTPVIFQGDTLQRGDKESIGILRNSNNRQYTLGGISKFNFDVSENLKTQVGIDYRYARIYHVKTIRDLLGGNYFVNTDSDFDIDGQQKVLGDPIDYNFTNFVNWLGFFGQAEYNTGDLTAYGMGGVTTVKYSHWNHFKKYSDYNFTNSSSKDGSDADWVEGLNDSRGGTDGELFIEADPITTSQFKGGLMYNLDDKLSFLSSIPVFGKVYDNSSVWFNAGVVNKTPIMDQVIYEDDGDVYYTPDPKNETFTSFELGLNTGSNDGTMAAKFSFYSTTWSDRIEIRTLSNVDADDNVAHITGIEQIHSGIEGELAWQVIDMARLDIGFSYGNWVYNDNATGSYIDDGSDVEYGYALKDLKVGDMPQNMLLMGLTANPIEGSAVRFQYRYYDAHFADWELSSREYDPSEYTENDNPNLSFSQQVWQAPSYGVLDIHASYELPFEFGPAKPKLYVNILNALDATFIQDAVDNSKYNSFGNKLSTADDAEVYFGLPTSFNMGLTINF